jgi:aspartate aminotransferase-like enzyme
MVNPRGPEFAELLERCLAGLGWGLQTANRILLFPGSGTGGLEAAVVNLLSPGERGVFCTAGWFGDLWATIAESYGADVVRVASAWGEPLDPGRLDSMLAAEPTVTKVFVTHCETSTGVLNDIHALSAVARRHGCLLAVDTISGAPGHSLPIDELGLDLVVSASQKGWLAPPGLTMVAVSEAAMAASADARCPRWYLDFRRQASAQDNGMMHTTPPLSVMYALAEGLAILRSEGLESMWARHARVARLARGLLGELGLELVSGGRSPSNTVSAVHSPFASQSRLATLLSDLHRRERVVLAAGLGELEGRAFRIGHLGSVRERDIDVVMSALGRALAHWSPRRSAGRGREGLDQETAPRTYQRRPTLAHMAHDLP